MTTYEYTNENCVTSFLLHKVHKVLTHVEHRAVSGVFHTIDPPPPLQPASVSSLAHLPGCEGGGGSIFWRTPDKGLVSYSIIFPRLGCFEQIIRALLLLGWSSEDTSAPIQKQNLKNVPRNQCCGSESVLVSNGKLLIRIRKQWIRIHNTARNIFKKITSFCKDKNSKRGRKHQIKILIIFALWLNDPE